MKEKMRKWRKESGKMKWKSRNAKTKQEHWITPQFTLTTCGNYVFLKEINEVNLKF
jgi:hypothetical protein